MSPFTRKRGWVYGAGRRFGGKSGHFLWTILIDLTSFSNWPEGKGGKCVCAVQINGFTAINLTKLDVLSGEKEIKLGVAYKDPATGETIDFMPADAEYLATLEVRLPPSSSSSPPFTLRRFAR